MKLIADLHIHSKYSRSTSPQMEVESLSVWAKKKGIQVVGTGDFSHPEYFKLLKDKLKESSPGLYTLKKGGNGTHFLLTNEISNIYSQGGKTRRIHTLVMARSLDVVEKINAELGKRGNISSDGRPIFGFSAKELIKIVLDASPDCFVVPAHAWTPWFAVFGSKSGFDDLEECFEEETRNIYAIETGLSSDPAMNWRVSALDRLALISNSDAHSPSKLGREANVLDCEMSYRGITETFKKKDRKSFLYTIEFFPDEGKYHYDGHRLCKVSLHPREAKERQNKCPVCFKPLTLGVMHRVEELADRPWNYHDERFIPQRHAVPLIEILSEVLGSGVASAKVEKSYEEILAHGVPELELLLETPAADLGRLVPPEVAEGILKVRQGKVKVIPGYDGEYGKVRLFEDEHVHASARERKKNREKPGQIEMF